MRTPEAEVKFRRSCDAPWTAVNSTGLSADSVLLYALQSVDWRLERLEISFLRLVRLWTWATRLYRRFGHMLLRTPVARICHKLMGHLAADEKYRRWFLQHQATDPYSDSGIAEAIVRSQGPLVSLIMPVYQPNLEWLMAAVKSVRTQTYDDWQLLIVLDGGPSREVLNYLQPLASEDPRIQCLFSDRGGISSTLNLGLSVCSGGYAAFIDQDDTLEPTALAHVAAAITHDEPDIIYTDEDYVDERGAAHLPLFKPAWSPALLFSCMYFGHLIVVNTERARKIGGFRTAYDGAQDYDFVLRLTDEDARVVHIPRVLYHWRRHPGSTAANPGAKSYSHPAGRNALQDTLDRRGLNAVVCDGPCSNSYRLSHELSAEDSAAIIVPTRNSKLLSRLLDSMPEVKGGLRREVHVILHCQGTSEDERIAAVARRFGARITEYRGPFNFALMNNLAAARLSNPYLVLMNDDVVIGSDHWLEDLCAPFIRPEVGVVGARLLYPDGTIEHCGVVTGIGEGVGHSGRFEVGSPFWPWLELTRNVSAVTGACMAIRRTVFERIGGFDTRFFNNYNDVDLCLRAQSAGFEVVLSAGSNLRHDGGRTREAGTALRERIDFWTQWGTVLAEVDYFYSPNLSRRLETIDLSALSLQ
uniref:Glycosyl transferase, family 2 n=1 Tax=Solibacter usitatus (strain Ellin6076) TaxID=234267 RepID=Q01R60_SOLUE